MSIKLDSLTERYAVRRLTRDDLPALLALCRTNPLYYQHMHLQPTLENLAEALTALPPGKAAADKYFVGFWQGEKLAAILDLITGYPAPTTAFFGWFMLDAAYQGAGEGSRLLQELLRGLRAAGFQRVRLAYIKGNPQSEHFWRKNAFFPTGEEPAAERYTMVVLQRLL